MAPIANTDSAAFPWIGERSSIELNRYVLVVPENFEISTRAM